MAIKSKSIVTVAALAVGGPLLLGVEAGEPVAAPPVRLDAPRVMKLDWNTRSVCAADLNGDGRSDLAVINNDRARIDLLYQADPDAPKKPTKRTLTRDRWEPVLDDAPFVKSSVVTGVGMFDLVVADFNGDGRADLAYTGRPDALTLRYQSADEQFTEKRTHDLPDVVPFPGTLVAGDVDGDKKTDLLVLGEKAISVLVQGKDGKLASAVRYPLADACFDLKLVDANGDGKADLVYSASDPRNALRVRFGRGDGVFGPERMFNIEGPRTALVPIEIAKSDVPAFAYVAEATDMLTVARLAPPDDKQDDMGAVVRHLAPRVFATRSDAKTPCAYAISDIDGDGRLDIAVGDPQGAEMLVFLQTEKGQLSDPKRYPSPADVRSIAAVDADGDGKGELFVVSRREKLLAVSRWGEPGRLTYPDPIRVEGDPLAVASVRLGAKGEPGVVVLVAQDRKRYLATLRPPAEGVAEWAGVRVELTGMRSDPSDVRVIDANQDGRDDLAIFTPGDPVKLMIQSEDGAFADPGAAATEGAAAAASAGLVDRLAASALTVGDADGDGKAEVLIATDAYARSMKLDGAGKLDVIDQYNARSSEAQVDAAVVADVNGDGKGEILLLDRRSQTIQLLARDEAGVYRYAEQVPMGKIDLVEARVLDFDGDKRDDLLLFGKDRFWLVPLLKADLAHETLATWETDVKDLSHTAIAAGDLNGDGLSELVLVDAADTRVMEILSRDSKGDWNASLFFKVFEQDPYYAGRGGAGTEPRQMLVADVTGDKKNDLILLVHDRVLVYPQK